MQGQQILAKSLVIFSCLGVTLRVDYPSNYLCRCTNNLKITSKVDKNANYTTNELPYYVYNALCTKVHNDLCEVAPFVRCSSFKLQKKKFSAIVIHLYNFLQAVTPLQKVTMYKPVRFQSGHWSLWVWSLD